MKRTAVILSVVVAAMALVALMLSVASAAPSAPTQSQDFRDRVVFTKTVSTETPVVGEVFTFTLQFHTTSVETQTVYVRVTDPNPDDRYLKIITAPTTIRGGAWYSPTIKSIVWEGEFGPSTIPDDVTFQVQVTGIPNTALAAGYLVTNTATMIDLTGVGSLPDGTAKATIRIMPRRIFLPLVLRNYPPSWQQASDTDGIEFYDIAVCPSNPLLQYAGTYSANGLYRSENGGETWQQWALSERATPVVVNPTNNCTEAFVGTWGNGVYRVTGQNQAAQINQGLGSLHLYGLAITADGQTLYAGTNTDGVYRTSTSNINWTAVNNGISDLRISSLYLISDTLYAGSQLCTYYYSSDGGNSWTPETILSGGQECGDAQVWAIAEVDNVLYAGLQNGLYWKPQGGTWESVSDVPTASIKRSGLHSHLSRLYVGTYGNGVYTCDSDGNCQPLQNSGLGTSNIRSLTVANITPDARLLAGSDDGIWWVPLEP